MANGLQLVDNRNIQDFFNEAMNVAKAIGEQAKKTAGKADASVLTDYSDKIQNAINSMLSKGGLITQEEVDKLDEQVRLAKKKMLEEKSKNTLVQYGIIVGGLVFTFGVLWLLTKNKNNG